MRTTPYYLGNDMFFTLVAWTIGSFLVVYVPNIILEQNDPLLKQYYDILSIIGIAAVLIGTIYLMGSHKKNFSRQLLKKEGKIEYTKLPDETGEEEYSRTRFLIVGYMLVFFGILVQLSKFVR